MLRLTLPHRARLQHTAIVGADVPVFNRFPYRASDILRLYKDFWRLVLRYPENERHDLIFRLRNEFRSKRYMGHKRLVGKAYARGQSLLDMYKGRLEYSESIVERRLVSRAGAAALRAERDIFDRTVAAAVGGAAVGGKSTAEAAAARRAREKRQEEAAASGSAAAMAEASRSNILGLDDDDDIDGLGLGVYASTIRTPQRRPLTGTTDGVARGATSSVSTLWEQIQQGTNSTIPNLRHYRHSKQTGGSRPANVNNAPYVPSR